MNSLFLKLNIKDFGKGLLLAIITAVIGTLYQLLMDKGFDLSPVDFQMIIKMAITAFVGYLAKNLATNSEGKFGNKE